MASSVKMLHSSLASYRVGRKRERYEEEGSIGNEKAAGGNEKSF
jgi:hypothetical protein